MIDYSSIFHLGRLVKVNGGQPGTVPAVNPGAGKYGDDLIEITYPDGSVVGHSPNLESYYANREIVAIGWDYDYICEMTGFLQS